MFNEVHFKGEKSIDNIVYSGLRASSHQSRQNLFSIENDFIFSKQTTVSSHNVML